MVKTQVKNKPAASGSRTFKILLGLVAAVSLAGLAGIFLHFGKVEQSPKEPPPIDQPRSSGPRYHYVQPSGGWEHGEANSGPGTQPGVGSTRVPRGPRTSQLINPNEDPEGFIRARFEESPWMWEKAAPEEKEKIFEQFRERMLRLQEMGRFNSTGTGKGMGKIIHEKRWAGREKKGGRHARHQRFNPAGENEVNPGTEGVQAPPPGAGGGNREGQGGGAGNYNDGGGQGSNGY